MKNILLSAFLVASCSLFATPAPDFTVTDSEGKTHHLYADYVNQGKVLVFEIFFVNCPPCAGHAPYWENLYVSVKNQHPGKVEFMNLSDKSADLNSIVQQYKLAKGLTMPAVGSDGGSLAAVQPYKNGQYGPFYGTPTFVVVAPGTGEVIFDVRGDDPISTMDLIRQQVDQLLLPKCRIRSVLNDTLQNYTLRLQAPGSAPVSYAVTDGSYSLENFPGIPAAPYYFVSAEKTDNPLNGVSTFDLVQINRQILGIEAFKKNWQYLAADANNSGTVTTSDIVELRKLILGIYDSLPGRPSWIFDPAEDTLSSAGCPLIQAIKSGDVNGNADPAGFSAGAESRNRPDIEWHYAALSGLAGSRHQVALRADVSEPWTGLQGDLLLDAQVFRVLDVRSDVLPGFGPDSWHLQGDRLSLSWFSSDAVLPDTDIPLLTIDVELLQNRYRSYPLAMDGKRLSAEIYGGREIYRWALAHSDAGSRPVLYPNPARESFFVRMREISGPVRVFDGLGRLVFEEKHPVSDSDQEELEIHPGSLLAGLYWVQAGDQFAGCLHWQH